MNQPEPSPASSNLAFLEGIYADYLQDPNSVSPEWQDYFHNFLNGEAKTATSRLGPSFQTRSLFNPPAREVTGGETTATVVQTGNLQERVIQMIRNFRVRGHRIAQIDPLGQSRPCPPELDVYLYGFSESELNTSLPIETLQCDGPLTVRQIIERLQSTYCKSIGVQYMHIDDLAIRRWLQKRMEGTANRLELSRQAQLRILTRLTDAVTLEEFIRRKFIGAKSFSLEGSESLIPLLDLAIEKAGEQGIKEIVFGMAHRGRLNVLANIIGKNPREIFREFADKDPELYRGGGDVKYHLGYSGDWTTEAGKQIHLSLCFNPSHLEFVNPVAMGRTRAKQDRAADTERNQGMNLLIHGDAAFPGEGVIQETLNLSLLPGYAVGGTLHIVVNNQIGFTTSPKESRSSLYATDVAKMLQSPIFHVNGEDPEAVAQVVHLAMEFRHTFKRDVFIDMYAYRRLGHNEGDEPTFTQPVLYRAIEQRKPVREGYLEHLLKLEGIKREEADKIAAERRERLEKELSASSSPEFKRVDQSLHGLWSGYVGGEDATSAEPDTGIDKSKLSSLLEKQTNLPPDFHAHPKIERFIESRREMAKGQHPIDWSAAEALAFASLSADGHRVRLSGQDSGRGTFSHRHAVLYDYNNGNSFIPLQHLSPDQAKVEIINSPLSETGVLGFDYGYSLDCPNGLVLWEAQFGDFVNAAQVIIDQFIVSAEDKWHRLSGLVMLLPHGFEGSGPEHSSARLERFLALAAEDNIQVVYPTTAAQYFHMLRRQVKRNWRKPLIVMTPKSLLRDPRVASNLEELARGKFQRIIPDPMPPQAVKRILLCTGKIYYELEKQRTDLKRNDVAIIRLEQLYPINLEGFESILGKYPKGTSAFWVQEEPENMGAWRYLRAKFGETLFKKFPFSGIYRPASASPATGSMNSHKIEQKELLAEAFSEAKVS
ncbi:2-oxoglutarate dehydrogenase E1 component [Pedosphaera parvula]|uniref:2-oxoglutarate dehydrogenase E1 component n=1 Tax=Pedosphaera parvula (strain Ellin514) TaxID=320771 RepID=B9XMW8_PEDPL|nr:2-oxoglutarate dehydrogenase E1 component [Pedosphaera parvula]EEF58764.1 2-oxoglutarate dehydrogenase, E1 subunit [Pedosphaera parvula Ellin514]